jgi:hypothetical protein
MTLVSNTERVVSFNDTLNSKHYMASVVDEWLRVSEKKTGSIGTLKPKY